MFGFCKPISSKKRFLPYRVLNENFSFTLYDKADQISNNDWDTYAKQKGIFLNRAYLKIIEKSLFTKILCRYVIVYNKGEACGIIYFQVLDFNAGAFTGLIDEKSLSAHKTALKKEIKWGMDIYTYNSKNVVGWGGFKNFFSIWFYNGVFLSDPYNVLITATEGKTKSLRQWRLTSNDEFNESKILEYINESIQTIVDGKEIVAEKGKLKEATGLLKDYLQDNKELQNAFSQLTPGRQKEYIEYLKAQTDIQDILDYAEKTMKNLNVVRKIGN